jgi:hypothetical protein
MLWTDLIIAAGVGILLWFIKRRLDQSNPGWEKQPTSYVLVGNPGWEKQPTSYVLVGLSLAIIAVATAVRIWVFPQ